MKSPLLLKYTFSPEKLPTARLVISRPQNRLFEQVVPMLTFTANKPEETLYCINEFYATVDVFQWNGPNQFKYFHMALKPSLHYSWDTLIAGEAQTTDNLRAAIESMMNDVFDDDSFERFKSYMSTLKKPSKWSTPRLAQRFDELLAIAVHMPHHVAVPEEDKKRWFFDMFPAKQRETFTRHYDLTTSAAAQ